MKNWLKIIFFTSFAFFFQELNAQQISISGKVIDASDKQPLPFCNVFISNTTIGVNSDDNGVFKFNNVDLLEFELAFTYVGYKNFTKKIVAKPGEQINLLIELSPSDNLLSEIEVKSKRDKKWERQLKKFKSSFFGESDFAKKCEIENAWVLNFEENDGKFTASADQALKIKNNSLGYNLLLILKEFELEKDKYKIATNVQFIEMEPNNKSALEKFLENRRESYKNSPAFLFKSILENKSTQNGFTFFKERPSFVNLRGDFFQAEVGKSVDEFLVVDMVGMGKTPLTKRIYIPENLEIHNQSLKTDTRLYSDIDYAVSWMSVRGNNVYFDEKLNIINKQDIVVSGEMNSLRISGLLPLDFNVELDINDSYFLKFEKPKFIEVVHVHTDRDVYYKGEKIWMKAYMNYTSFSPLDSASKVLYINLLDSQKKIISKQKLEIDNGYAYGQINLPDSLANHYFTLTAHTNYMLNFKNNIFNKPIVILNQNQIVPTDGLVNSEFKNFKFDTKTLGDSLELFLSDSLGKGLEANLSFAALNPKFSKQFQNSDIISTNLSLKKDKISQSFKYKKEQGLVIEGVVLDNLKNGFETNFEIISTNAYNFYEGKSNKTGSFRIEDLQFYDNSQLMFKTKSKKEKLVTVIIKNDNYEPELTFYNLKTEIKLNQTNLFIPNKPNVLKDASNSNVEEGPKMLYGSPDFVVESKDFNANLGMQGVANALTSRVPNMFYRNGNFTIRGGSITKGSNFALILINGIPVSNFEFLDPNTISRIEVVSRISPMYGDQGRNGIVSFILKNKNEQSVINSNPSIKKINPEAYTFPLVFEKANFQMADGSNLPTIYWNPGLNTDKKGNVKVSIGNVKKPYMIVIEGITQQNQPFKLSKLIE